MSFNYTGTQYVVLIVEVSPIQGVTIEMCPIPTHVCTVQCVLLALFVLQYVRTSICIIQFVCLFVCLPNSQGLWSTVREVSSMG